MSGVEENGGERVERWSVWVQWASWVKRNGETEAMAWPSLGAVSVSASEMQALWGWLTCLLQTEP